MPYALTRILKIREIHKITVLFSYEVGAVECVKHSVTVALARCGYVIRTAYVEIVVS